MQTFIGRNLEAITLTRFDDERTEALSDNYLRLLVEGHRPANRFVSVRVDNVRNDGLIGHIGSEKAPGFCRM